MHSSQRSETWRPPQRNIHSARSTNDHIELDNFRLAGVLATPLSSRATDIEAHVHSNTRTAGAPPVWPLTASRPVTRELSTRGSARAALGSRQTTRSVGLRSELDLPPVPPRVAAPTAAANLTAGTLEQRALSPGRASSFGGDDDDVMREAQLEAVRQFHENEKQRLRTEARQRQKRAERIASSKKGPGRSGSGSVTPRRPSPPVDAQTPRPPATPGHAHRPGTSNMPTRPNTRSGAGSALSSRRSVSDRILAQAHGRGVHREVLERLAAAKERVEHEEESLLERRQREHDAAVAAMRESIEHIRMCAARKTPEILSASARDDEEQPLDDYDDDTTTAPTFLTSYATSAREQEQDRARREYDETLRARAALKKIERAPFGEKRPPPMFLSMKGESKDTASARKQRTPTKTDICQRRQSGVSVADSDHGVVGHYEVDDEEAEQSPIDERRTMLERLCNVQTYDLPEQDRAKRLVVAECTTESMPPLKIHHRPTTEARARKLELTREYRAEVQQAVERRQQVTTSTGANAVHCAKYWHEWIATTIAARTFAEAIASTWKPFDEVKRRHALFHPPRGDQRVNDLTRAAMLLDKNMLNFRIRRRIEKKRAAVTVLGPFMLGVMRELRMRWAVHQYLSKVRRVQRAYRRFRSFRQERVDMWSRQWLREEPRILRFVDLRRDPEVKEAAAAQVVRDQLNKDPTSSLGSAAAVILRRTAQNGRSKLKELRAFEQDSALCEVIRQFERLPPMRPTHPDKIRARMTELLDERQQAYLREYSAYLRSKRHRSEEERWVTSAAHRAALDRERPAETFPQLVVYCNRTEVLQMILAQQREATRSSTATAPEHDASSDATTQSLLSLVSLLTSSRGGTSPTQVFDQPTLTADDRKRTRGRLLMSEPNTPLRRETSSVARRRRSSVGANTRRSPGSPDTIG